MSSFDLVVIIWLLLIISLVTPWSNNYYDSRDGLYDVENGVDHNNFEEPPNYPSYEDNQPEVAVDTGQGNFNVKNIKISTSCWETKEYKAMREVIVAVLNHNSVFWDLQPNPTYNITKCFLEIMEKKRRLKFIEGSYADVPKAPYIIDLCNVTAQCIYLKKNEFLENVIDATQLTKLLAVVVDREFTCVLQQYQCKYISDFATLIGISNANHQVPQFPRVLLPLLMFYLIYLK